MYSIQNDLGKTLDTSFEFEDEALIFHSSGGKKGSPAARNIDYAVGLRTLLERVHVASFSITKVIVETKNIMHLSVNERTVFNAAERFLSPAELYSVVTTGMKNVGQKPGAKGGNSRKRLRIEFSPNTSPSQVLKAIRGFRRLGPSGKAAKETESSEDLRKNKSELLGPTFGPPPRSSGYTVTQNSGNELAYVYVARFGNTNIYKIGFAQNPTERLREFNHHIPLVELPDLQSWKIIFQSSALPKADAYKMEQATLNALSSSRTTGERVLCSEFELYRALKSVGIKSSGL